MAERDNRINSVMGLIKRRIQDAETLEDVDRLEDVLATYRRSGFDISVLPNDMRTELNAGPQEAQQPIRDVVAKGLLPWFTHIGCWHIYIVTMTTAAVNTFIIIDNVLHRLHLSRLSRRHNIDRRSLCRLFAARRGHQARFPATDT